ncbi:MAG: hypothetical protein LBP75_06270 [Planctomycetota bacterium]|nr:hypothetical protein [Planctomycetota bacterium]
MLGNGFSQRVALGCYALPLRGGCRNNYQNRITIVNSHLPVAAVLGGGVFFAPMAGRWHAGCISGGGGAIAAAKNACPAVSARTPPAN